MRSDLLGIGVAAWDMASIEWRPRRQSRMQLAREYLATMVAGQSLRLQGGGLRAGFPA